MRGLPARDGDPGAVVVLGPDRVGHPRLLPGRGRLQQALKRHGETPLGVEGMEDGRWVLMDLNDVIVHIFQPEVREHYDLERLWSDAPRVELDLQPPDDLQRSAN